MKQGQRLRERSIIVTERDNNILEANIKIKDILINEGDNINNINDLYDENNVILQEKYDLIEETNKLLDETLNNQGLQLKNIEKYIEKLTDLTNKANAIQPPTDDAEALVEILARTTQEYANQRDLIAKANKLAENYTDNNDKLYKTLKDGTKELVEGVNTHKGIILDIGEEEIKQLAILEGQKQLLAEANEIRLQEMQRQAYLNEETIKNNDLIEIQNGIKAGILASTLLDNIAARQGLETKLAATKDETQRLVLQLAINEKIKEEAGIVSDIADLKQNVYDIERDTKEKRAENKRLHEESLVIDKNIEAVTRQQGIIIAANAKVYLNWWQKAGLEVKKFAKKAGKFIGEFMDTWGQQLQEARDLTAAAFELAIVNETALADAKIAELERVAEEELKIEEDKLKEQQDLQEEYTDSLDDMYSMLADAEGERYEEILAQIGIQEAAKAAAAQAEIQTKLDIAAIDKQLEIDREKARERENKLKKRQAITDAIIGAALAVLSALSMKPFIPLGIISAALAVAMGVVQVATIKKQQYAEGGFTGKGAKHEPAGVVHKGEYVIPQKVMRAPQAQGMVNVLEAMRVGKRGYAEGGAVSGIPNIPSPEEMLDYPRIGNEVARAMKENPMFVSWIEWRDMTSKMQFIGSRAGFGKK